jgi:hypothetical protein
MLAGYGTLLSDQLVVSDSVGLGYGVQFTDTLNNWADLVSKALIMALTLSDSDTTNWNDVLAGLGYGNVFADSTSMADQTMAGYGAAVTDQMVLVDSTAVGYGATFAESIANWADARTAQLSAALTLADGSLQNWADSTAIGYGLAFNEQLTLLDVPGLGLQYGFTDSLNNWLDQLTSLLQGTIISLATNDTLNYWQELLGAGYGNALFDTGGANWTDAIGVGYGFALQDTLSFWLDQLGTQFVAFLTVGVQDNLNNWQDFTQAQSTGALAVADTLVFGEQLTIGYGNLVSDQQVPVDQLAVGYGFLLSDSGFNWRDFIAITTIEIIPIYLTLTDTETANWADAFAEMLAFIPTSAKYRAIQITQVLVAAITTVQRIYALPNVVQATTATVGVTWP